MMTEVENYEGGGESLKKKRQGETFRVVELPLCWFWSIDLLAFFFFKIGLWKMKRKRLLQLLRAM